MGLPYKYREVLEYLRSSGLRAEDRVLRPLPFPQPARASLPLRDYQRRAVDAPRALRARWRSLGATSDHKLMRVSA
ncbi:MAG: hypothetical protein RXO24_09880 [Acidilobus sp.]